MIRTNIGGIKQERYRKKNRKFLSSPEISDREVLSLHSKKEAIKNFLIFKIHNKKLIIKVIGRRKKPSFSIESAD